MKRVEGGVHEQSRQQQQGACVGTREVGNQEDGSRWGQGVAEGEGVLRRGKHRRNGFSGGNGSDDNADNWRSQ